LNKDHQQIGHIIIGGGELAYFLIESEWGKGYTSEAATALTKIAVPILITQHGVSDPTTITATVRRDHKASQGVLSNAGLILGDELNTKVFNGITVDRLDASVPTATLIQDYVTWKNSLALTVPVTHFEGSFFNHSTPRHPENQAAAAEEGATP
jgi:hypothetical protein